jgi:hypothetical protein
MTFRDAAASREGSYRYPLAHGVIACWHLPRAHAQATIERGDPD